MVYKKDKEKETADQVCTASGKEGEEEGGKIQLLT